MPSYKPRRVVNELPAILCNVQDACSKCAKNYEMVEHFLFLSMCSLWQCLSRWQHVVRYE